MRKLLFRAHRRGIRELDILVGDFADQSLADMSDRELDDFEAMLRIPDQTLYAALRGDAPVPATDGAATVRRLIDFIAGRPRGPGAAAAGGRREP